MTFFQQTKFMIVVFFVVSCLCLVIGASSFAMTCVGAIIGLLLSRSIYADIHGPDPSPWWETGWYPGRDRR